jgi:hypothetical protein
MKKKIIAILLAFLMVTVSVGFAAVTVTIDNPTDGVVDADVSIPVKITGFNDFLAGEFVFDFGDTALEGITIENGTVYPNGLEDYSAVAVLQDMIDKNGWENIKDAAIFYEVLGSRVKIYLYGPDATSELTGGLADGVLFNIKGTVGATAKSSFITFGGKAFNASLNLRKSAPVLTDYASLNITGETAIAAPVDPDDLDETTGADIKDPITLTKGAGTTPAAFDLVLKPVDTTAGNIEAKIPAATTVELEDGTPYTGLIKPPKVVTLTDEQKAKFNKVWQDDEDLVAFTMGNPSAKLVLDKPMLMTLTIVRASDAPAFNIYYLPENAAPELAGIDGTASIGGEDVNIAKGGTILETQADTPDDEKTTYTVAVLLDHMSSYVAASSLPTAAPAASGDSSDCFINTAGFDSNSGSSMGLLFGLMAMALGFGCIGYYLKRKRETMF